MEKEKLIKYMRKAVACYNENPTDCLGRNCCDCPHDYPAETIELIESALELLEEAKEAIPHRNYQYLSDYWCECGWHLGKKGDVKFCADCGRRIKWD